MCACGAGEVIERDMHHGSFPPLLLQVMLYCSKCGIKYALLSCWWFTWAVKLDKNDIHVSPPFPWDSMQPTINGVRELTACPFRVFPS